jgi:hypothetical protein
MLTLLVLLLVIVLLLSLRGPRVSRARVTPGFALVRRTDRDGDRLTADLVAAIDRSCAAVTEPAAAPLVVEMLDTGRLDAAATGEVVAVRLMVRQGAACTPVLLAYGPGHGRQAAGELLRSLPALVGEVKSASRA